jgi:DNA-binding response OmpR family regulator
VLVVDDEADIRITLAEALKDEGYAVSCAENGAVALRLAREQGPDVIVIDLMMPVMDGWAFLQACRAEPYCASTRVIVLSAALTSRIGELPVQAIIRKPFDLGELLDTVERIAAA